MNKTYCDRCNKEIRSENPPTMRFCTGFTSYEDRRVHLCHLCVEAFREFLTNNPMDMYVSDVYNALEDLLKQEDIVIRKKGWFRRG